MQALTAIADLWLRLFSLHMFEISLFIGIVWVLDRCLRMSARVRYGLWLLALVKVFVPPVFSLPASLPEALPVQFLAPATILTSPSVPETGNLNIALPVFGIWLFSVCVMIGLVVAQNINLRRRLRGAKLAPMFDSPASGRASAHEFQILEAKTIRAPILLGFFRPRLYLPAEYRTWPAVQLASILAHETAHLRSRDLWVLVPQTLALTLFGLNPLVWLLHARLTHLREIRCDLMAIRDVEISPLDYSKMLVAFLEKQSWPLLPAAAGSYFSESRPSISSRLHHLLNLKEVEMKPLSPWHYLLASLIALAILPLSWQCSEQPEQTLDSPSAPPPALEKPATFVPYDTPPEPVGGFAALARNLRYPEIARKAGIEGKVLVRATISADGSVSNTTVVESLGEAGCDEAAIEAIKSVDWKPAQKDGTPVSVEITVPFQFKLNGNKGKASEDKPTKLE